MKLLFIAVLFFYFMNFSCYAQIIVGPQVAYNSRAKNPGVGIKIGFVSFEKFKAAADVSVYHSLYKGDIDRKFSDPDYAISKYYNSEANLNFSYIFRNRNISLYPLVGINIYRQQKQDIFKHGNYLSPDYYRYSKNNTQVVTGVNAGGGAQINFGLLSFYIESKYTFSTLTNATIMAGLIFNIQTERPGIIYR